MDANSSQDVSTSLTKTKAKKSLLLSLDKLLKPKILKELKKSYPNSSISSSLNGEKIDLVIEFSSYKEAKDAKTALAKVYNNDVLKIESQLFKVKKEKRQKDKVESKENKFNEQYGQMGDRSRNLFEIRVPKIILRNLSFKFNEETLRKEMEKYGQVEVVNLPKRDGEKNHNGFGFVTFKNLKDAQKAIETLNSKVDKLNGTKVAVDWCLPKNLYLKNTAENQNANLNETTENDKGEEDDDDDDDDKEDQESEHSSDDHPKKLINKSKGNSLKEAENDKQKRIMEKNKFEIKKKTGTLDVQEKRTVFVRNLSFDATEESVKEAFLKYGSIKYVKLCYDKDLERPKGTAFIQFENNQSALNACAESDIFELDMRKLQIDMAISRNQVNDIVEEKKTSTKETKDGRNLGLLKEGVIYPNSYEAKDVSKADMLRRQKLEADNAEKLKLLHYFVSPTRLSVHNIPIKCTDQEFREIFYKAIDTDSSDKRTHRGGIKECRIMRDLSRVNADGVGRSKGYGFVEFSSFELAKKALHATNNNAKLFSNGNRLIVQFSVEDTRALQKKQARLEKSKLKLKRNKSAFDRFKTKKNVPAPENGTDPHDQEEIKKKQMQKNLLKVHSVEKKLLKKKLEEENKIVKKKKKVMFNEKKINEKLSEREKKIQMLNEKKMIRRKSKKLNKKNTQFKKAAKQTVDNVDKLVDKLYNSKNKMVQKKWYD